MKEGKRKKKSGEPTEPSRSGALQIIANPPPGFTSEDIRVGRSTVKFWITRLAVRRRVTASKAYGASLVLVLCGVSGVTTRPPLRGKCSDF